MDRLVIRKLGWHCHAFVAVVCWVIFYQQWLKCLGLGCSKSVTRFLGSIDPKGYFPRFTLYGIEYQEPSSAIDLLQFEQLTLAVNANRLLEPMICINEVIISGLQFNLESIADSTHQSAETASAPVTAISTPVLIKLGRLTLNNIQLNLLGNQIDWQHFTTSGSLQGDRLTIDRTLWRGVRIALAEEQTDPSAATSASSSDALPISLPEVIIPLRIELSRFELRDFLLEQASPIAINRLVLQAQAFQSQIDVKT
ncbi:hypothetical protein ACT691_07975 [Vibrio metschnikovii]